MCIENLQINKMHFHIFHQFGYLNPQYCWEGNVSLILVTTHDGSILLFLLPSTWYIHLVNLRYAM